MPETESNATPQQGRAVSNTRGCIISSGGKTTVTTIGPHAEINMTGNVFKSGRDFKSTATGTTAFTNFPLSQGDPSSNVLVIKGKILVKSESVDSEGNTQETRVVSDSGGSTKL